MTDEEMEELARQLAEQIAKDIESGTEVFTEARPAPDLTAYDVEIIKQALDPPFRVNWRLYAGIDFGYIRDRTVYYFPTS